MGTVTEAVKVTVAVTVAVTVTVRVTAAVAWARAPERGWGRGACHQTLREEVSRVQCINPRGKSSERMVTVADPFSPINGWSLWQRRGARRSAAA